MGVGVAGPVKNVLEPRASRDSIGIQPVSFHLHDPAIERVGSVEVAGSERASNGLVQACAGGGKVIDCLENGIEIKLAEILAFGEVMDKVANVISIVGEIERQDIGIRQAQRQHAPEL